MNIPEYLTKRYQGTPILTDPGSHIPLNAASMSVLSGKSARNCSLAAICRVLEYWRMQKGKTNIKGSLKEIYDEVEVISKGYGYTDEKGLFPTKIDNVMHDAFSLYGYESVCRGIYFWSFEDQVKKEIDMDRPVVMNILRGFYRDHTVAICGYCIYRINDKEYPMIKVADGWNQGYRYIDFNAFTDLFTSGIGSFNTAEVK